MPMFARSQSGDTYESSQSGSGRVVGGHAEGGAWSEAQDLSSEDLSDSQCLVAIARGDMACLAEVIERYQDRLINLLFRLVGDWDSANDLTQEAFLKILRRATTFHPAGNASAWVISVAINLGRDYLRRRRRIVAIDSLESTAESASANPARNLSALPSEQLEREELHQEVHQALATMSDTGRSLLLLRDFEGMSYEDLSQVMNCEMGTVKSRLHRARKQFEEAYRQGRRVEGGRTC